MFVSYAARARPRSRRPPPPSAKNARDRCSRWRAGCPSVPQYHPRRPARTDEPAVQAAAAPRKTSSTSCAASCDADGPPTSSVSRRREARFATLPPRTMMTRPTLLGGAPGGRAESFAAWQRNAPVANGRDAPRRAARPRRATRSYRPKLLRAIMADSRHLSDKTGHARMRPRARARARHERRARLASRPRRGSATRAEALARLPRVRTTPRMAAADSSVAAADAAFASRRSSLLHRDCVAHHCSAVASARASSASPLPAPAAPAAPPRPRRPRPHRSPRPLADSARRRRPRASPCVRSASSPTHEPRVLRRAAAALGVGALARRQ